MHNRLRQEQRRRNVGSRDRWERFREHRQHVMQLLLSAADATARLCVLGAGNCNDLQLSQLADAFAEVHLVDWDDAALHAAVARQQRQDDPRLRLFAPVDVTGVADELGPWNSAQPPAAAAIQQALETTRQAPPPELAGPYEVVASVCLLSQLVELAVMALGEAHPQCVPLVIAVRNTHLRQLVQLTRPGGQAFLITDFVSSDTMPQLARIPEKQLAASLLQAIEQQNFFTGVNPFALQACYVREPDIGGDVESVQLLSPWRWDFGTRMYAVTALQIRKRPLLS